MAKLLKKPTPPKHRYGVVATELGWACKKTGKILKVQKGLLEHFGKAAKKEEKKAAPKEEAKEEAPKEEEAKEEPAE